MAFASGLGLVLDPTTLSRIQRHVALLAEVNQRTNLTALEGEGEVLDRHLSDSVALAALLECRAGRVVDIGSGGGFPALPMAALLPACRFVLVEASSRKVAFLREAVRAMDLPNVVVEGVRVEDLGRDPLHRATYDRVVSRAFAALPVLLECALPLLAADGRLVAPRGANAAAELAACEGVAELLGGKVRGVRTYKLLSGVQLQAVEVDKISATPDRYPRKAGVPEKKPLTRSRSGSAH